MRAVEKVVLKQEVLHIILLLPDFASQIHFKAVVLVIFGKVSEHLVRFGPLQVTFTSHVPEVTIEYLIWIGGESLSGLFEHPLDLSEHLELLTGSFGLRHLPFEEIIRITTHQDAFLVADRIHHEIDDLSLALLEIVKGGK
jgi:hypothetical protein